MTELKIYLKPLGGLSEEGSFKTLDRETQERPKNKIRTFQINDGNPHKNPTFLSGFFGGEWDLLIKDQDKIINNPFNWLLKFGFKKQLVFLS